MVNVLFSAQVGTFDDYREPLTVALARMSIDADIQQDGFSPDQVDYIVFAPNGPVSDFTPFVNTKAILGLWAGVEEIVTNATLTQPLARMVDPGLTKGMQEWVVGHVMRHHLGLDADVVNPDNKWAPRLPPLAEERTIGILGMGALGSACANSLLGLGFNVLGWSRSPKSISGVGMRHGSDGLNALLGLSDIVVLLLPLTPQTECILDTEMLTKVKAGAVLLNPGRGGLIDDTALVEALDSGRISGATLDVFRDEPLPVDHPFWRHPKITVTPHIASATRPETAAGVIAENIRRGEAGLPFLHLVDRQAGY